MQDYSDNYRVVMIPPTTDSALVFPFDKSGKKFDRSFYSMALTDGRMSSEQLESFLGKIEKKLEKKVSGVQRLIRFFAGLGLFSMIILFLYGFCLFNEDENSFDGEDYVYDEFDNFGTALIGFCFAAIFYSVILGFYKKNRYLRAKKTITKFIKKHSSEFAHAGLRWNVPLSFPQWIELWKDYKIETTYLPISPPQINYSFPVQLPPSSQYPILPSIVPQRSSSNQNHRDLPKNLMNQPLLAHQMTDFENYVPPTKMN